MYSKIIKSERDQIYIAMFKKERLASIQIKGEICDRNIEVITKLNEFEECK